MNFVPVSWTELLATLSHRTRDAYTCSCKNQSWIDPTSQERFATIRKLVTSHFLCYTTWHFFFFLCLGCLFFLSKTKAQVCNFLANSMCIMKYCNNIQHAFFLFELTHINLPWSSWQQTNNEGHHVDSKSEACLRFILFLSGKGPSLIVYSHLSTFTYLCLTARHLEYSWMGSLFP